MPPPIYAETKIYVSISLKFGFIVSVTKTMLRLTALILLVPAVLGQLTEFTKCPNLPAPDSGITYSCGTIPCELKRGESFTGHIFFTPTATHATLKLDVRKIKVISL